ncbi:MAG: tetratricopeptide repeat protein [Planctomycetes bacterium]|nr:tetratricopeptide repeat protein [Planctomycetota bacterium]
MSRPRAVAPSFLAGLALIAAVVVTWAGTLRVPLQFDDVPAIVRNVHIAPLWPPDGHLWATPESPLAGRPVTAFTFAVDYALGELSPYGYHLVDLVLHAASACLLFGLLRRILPRALRDARRASGVAFATALLWAVHPLQSEAVAYVTQRTELLASFFVLATLYAGWRGLRSTRPGRWFLLSIACCALGMGSKEIAVAAPLLMLLVDRAFVSRRLGTALLRHRALHLGLASTWSIVVLLQLGSPRAASAGFGVGISPWSWLLTQSGVLLHMLRLSLWPHPLVPSYDWPLAASLLDVFPQALVLLLLLVATLVLVRRNAPAGVLGAFFFAILAPTSSVVPIATEVVAERRMYLPLAAVVLLVVLTLREGLRRAPRAAGAICLGALALGASSAARERVHAWQDPVELWSEAAEDRPQHAFAHYMLGNALRDAGRPEEARVAFERACELAPDELAYLVNLGNVHLELHDFAAAVEIQQRAVALAPDEPFARHNLAVALLMAGRPEDALPHLRRCVELVPDEPELRCNLAATLLDLGRDLDEARAQAEAALRLAPDGDRARAILEALADLDGARVGRTSDG